MKVLLATHEYPPYPGGIGRYCTEVYEAGRALGFDIDVAAPDYAPMPAIAAEVKPDARVHRYPGAVFTMSQLPRLAMHLRRIYKAGHYDVLHIADWPVLLALPWMGVTRQTRVVMTFHGTDAILLGTSRKARLLQAGHAVRRLDRICANSHFSLKLVDQYLNISAERERLVTHLGVAPYWFEPATPEDRASVRQLCAAAPDDKIVLTVARLDKRKGHAKAIAALAKLNSDERTRVRYLVIGASIDEAHTRSLHEQAQACGVNVTFAGKVPDAIVRAAYAESDLFLLLAEPDPSRVEGFGLVFLEAAAQGLQTLSTNVHAISEVVKPGCNGNLVASDDTAATVAALRQALWHADLKDVKAACIAHARQFTWQRCAQLTYAT